jgi:hypothetical protein
MGGWISVEIISIVTLYEAEYAVVNRMTAALLNTSSYFMEV